MAFRTCTLGIRYVEDLLAVIAAGDPGEKGQRLAAIQPPPDGTCWDTPQVPEVPGRPAHWKVDGAAEHAPRRRKGLAQRGSRLHFLHAIHHIEVTAIDLACLLCLRGSGAPTALHADFLRVAREEAAHAALLERYLVNEGYPPGTDAVHTRLWRTAVAAGELGNQLAAVPRILEARGLDVTAMILPTLAAVDQPAHEALQIIHRDEIGHVGAGTRWHTWWCNREQRDPEAHWESVLRTSFPDHVPSPFPLDRAGRLAAGFRDGELQLLTRPQQTAPMASPPSAT
jgi:uncharacterized ferritin-like protein (DUF455 family)